jgi:hypothetical protein
MAQRSFQRGKWAGARSAPAAGERDVRAVCAIFWNESASLRCRDNPLLKRQQFRRLCDINKEDSGAIEEACTRDANQEGWKLDLSQTIDDTAILIFIGLAEELQSNVPCLRQRPAQFRTEPHKRLDAVSNLISYIPRNGNTQKKPHNNLPIQMRGPSR